MALRGIRGATTVTENTKQAIIDATRTLIDSIMRSNEVEIDDIASIFFSVTHDLDAVFPAAAARELDMGFTPLLCLNEINIPNSLPKCIRILMHANTDKNQKDMTHVYLNDAVSLRPEFAQ